MGFVMEGADHPGLLYAVTDMFRQRGLLIDRLKSDSEIAPYGGTELFKMKGTIISRRDVNLDRLVETVGALKNSLDIELDLSCIKFYGTDDKNSEKTYLTSDLSS